MLSCQTHNYRGEPQHSPTIFHEDVAVTIVSFHYIFNCLNYFLFFEMEKLYIASEFIFFTQIAGPNACNGCVANKIQMLQQSASMRTGENFQNTT